jgi:hypothetical protein
MKGNRKYLGDFVKEKMEPLQGLGEYAPFRNMLFPIGGFRFFQTGKWYPFRNPVVTQNIPMEKGFVRVNMVVFFSFDQRTDSLL